MDDVTGWEWTRKSFAAALLEESLQLPNSQPPPPLSRTDCIHKRAHRPKDALTTSISSAQNPRIANSGNNNTDIPRTTEPKAMSPLRTRHTAPGDIVQIAVDVFVVQYRRKAI